MAKKAAAQQPSAAPAASATAAAPPVSSAAFIKLDEFIWMRDKFAGGLLNLENGVRELRTAYLNQCNSLIPEGHISLLDTSVFSSGYSGIPDVTLNHGLQAIGSGGAQAAAPGTNTKRKRKPHDPNAPKRALTSYFLFMQANKPQIKSEHPEWTAQQISEESERRWAHIDPEEKARYEFMYNVDLARYYKQKEEYDANRPIPDISSDEAQRLYEEHCRTGTLIKGRKGRKVLEAATAAGHEVPASANAAVNESSDEEDAESKPAQHADEDEAEGEDEDESQEEQAPPPKSKKLKTGKNAPAKETPKKKIESPATEKKGRSKKAKAAAEAESDISVPEEASAPAKKEKKTRKRKSSGKD